MNAIQSNAGVFPEKNTFIERACKETSTDVTRIKITHIRHRKLCPFFKPRIAVNHSLMKGR